MYFENRVQIERTVRHQYARNKHETKSEEEIEKIVAVIEKAVDDLEYDFSKFESVTLRQNGKKRHAKRYLDLYSPESILCIYIKRILDKTFRVKYPNRNRIVQSLFSLLPAVKQMTDFTIVKFDFKDYFNSISTEYALEKFLKPEVLNRFEADLVAKFSSDTKYAYAGLNTSNAIAEIIGSHFDDVIKKKLSSKQIIFFERYIDDSILIINEHVEEDEILSILKSALVEVFYDDTVATARKCRTKFNEEKFRYISRRGLTKTPVSVDYLGYEFWLSTIEGEKTVNIKYGVTQAKRDKYKKRVDKMIASYLDVKSKDYNDLELLRHSIMTFTSREVYLSKRFNSNIWKAKGFINNYGELRHMLGTGLIHEDTDYFLRHMVEEAFDRADIAKPYFLKGNETKSGYNLFDNMKTNKTILLVEHIGYDYKSLVKLCEKIGISNTNSDGTRRGYGTLVRDYLIKTKVGY